MGTIYSNLLRFKLYGQVRVSDHMEYQCCCLSENDLDWWMEMLTRQFAEDTRAGLFMERKKDQGSWMIIIKFILRMICGGRRGSIGLIYASKSVLISHRLHR